MRNARVHDQYIIKLEIQKSFNYWCYYDKLNNIVSTIFFVKQSFLQRYQQQNLMHHFNVCAFKLLSCTFMLAVSHNNPQLPLVNHPKRQLIQYPNLSLQSPFIMSPSQQFYLVLGRLWLYERKPTGDLIFLQIVCHSI